MGIFWERCNLSSVCVNFWVLFVCFESLLLLGVCVSRLGMCGRGRCEYVFGITLKSFYCCCCYVWRVRCEKRSILGWAVKGLAGTDGRKMCKGCDLL